MGIFGRKPQPAPEPYTPNPDPIYGELNPALTAPLPKKRGLFGNVGKVLGTVGDAVMYGPFMGQVQQARAENAENRQFKRQLLEEEVEAARLKRSQPSYHTVPGVGLVASYPDGRHETAVGAQPEDTPLLREMAAAGIDPGSDEGRLMIARAARGYQHSPEMVEQRIATERAIAEARAAATAAHRAPAQGGRITATAVDANGNRVGWNGSAWVSMN